MQMRARQGVLVDGVVTFEEGKCTGAAPGLLMRNRRFASASLGCAA